jgi:glycerate kinase
VVKVLICPDKFKGSLTAVEVCDAVERGIKKISIDCSIEKIPLADGGEGTFDFLVSHFNGKIIHTEVNDPLFRKIISSYGISDDRQTGFIEMAKASGLQFLEKEKRNPLYTTSFGTGELILHAINNGAKKIILGIGGSATNDAGIGMANALGFQFYDEEKKILAPIGKSLSQISIIKKTAVADKLKGIEFTILSDVKNPLSGKEGAAYVYGPQKGASESDVKMLDAGLKRFSSIVKTAFKENAEFPGAGAAGGLGAGARIFLNAEIKSGIEFIVTLSGLEEKIKGSDVVITGEGKVDDQTFYGKVVGEVSRLTSRYGKQLIIICGKSEINAASHDELQNCSLIQLVGDGVSEEDAIKDASSFIETKISHLDFIKK